MDDSDFDMPDDRVLLDRLIKNKSSKTPREYPEYVYEALQRKYPKAKTARDYLDAWGAVDKINSKNIYLRPEHITLPMGSALNKVFGGNGALAANFPTSFNGLIPNLGLGAYLNDSASTIALPGVNNDTVMNDDNYEKLGTLRHEYEHAKDYKNSKKLDFTGIFNSKHGSQHHHRKYTDYFENVYPIQLRLQERKREGIKDDPEYLKKMFIDEVSQRSPWDVLQKKAQV